MKQLIPPVLLKQIQLAINHKRLLKTAISLIEVPSPTLSAGLVANRLSEILKTESFEVERPIADWPDSPAVVTRLESGKPGRTLQFDGHLDTVHLPFVPPRFENGFLYGSGSSDMKGGIAAFVEALRVLRETGALKAGRILLTAHDHHEGPWGDGRQLRSLIDKGYVGDGVLLPEYLGDRLPLSGRGAGIFEIKISRKEPPVHEVLRSPNLPDVLGTGVKLVSNFSKWHKELSRNSHPYSGSDSVFIGRLESGEIYNQSPQECLINGMRRWITPNSKEVVEKDFHSRLQVLAKSTKTDIEAKFLLQAEAFHIDPDDPLVSTFQAAYTAVTGNPLKVGGKPFVDDGNVFSSRANIAALTHGPQATGAHTINEKVSLDELVRVAQLYVLTAISYCQNHY